MAQYNLAFLGFGNVGQALARLLLRKREELASRYSITYTVTAIATRRHGSAINPDGLDIEKALAAIQTGNFLDELSITPSSANSMEFIQSCGADVLFENTPVNYTDGQPALNHLRAALENGMHAITANKGPVIHGYRGLTILAKKKARNSSLNPL